MNEQIKQIALETGLITPQDDEENWQEYINDVEKFAVRLIKECTEVVAKFAEEWCREGESPDYGYERAIKKHFGVEE